MSLFLVDSVRGVASFQYVGGGPKRGRRSPWVHPKRLSAGWALLLVLGFFDPGIECAFWGIVPQSKHGHSTETSWKHSIKA